VLCLIVSAAVAAGLHVGKRFGRKLSKRKIPFFFFQGFRKASDDQEKGLYSAKSLLCVLRDSAVKICGDQHALAAA
jgi:hypothetical protein